ncbi:glycoside hydrolase family 16 protein [Hymenobacter sp. BT664]|uniref:Glycoside hydrolase family 16 protein n=1 Tax=Hymenobacter montanus TaxID=2771359 RepID=A0A927BD11_9BACT|nr:family 16 glycosylhydrolase [Hymenobacter montanus]MBD2768546.1 glycoside hydrolase family 16 protein [Hymenobacter montanus]
MKTSLCFALLTFGAIQISRSQSLHIDAPVVLRYDDWEILFEDYFNYPSTSSITTNHWETEYHPTSTYCANAIPNSNSTIREWYNGTNAMSLLNTFPSGLRISASEQDHTCELTGDRYRYSSGMLRSKDAYRDNFYTTGNDRGFLNGMFEIRCKLPPEVGTTPAFWLNGTHAWPPELDIFEIYSIDKSKMFSSVHYGNNSNPQNCGIHFQADYPGYFALASHTWTCIWTPTTITFYLDGTELYTLTSPYNNDATFNAMELITNLGVHSNASPGLAANLDIEYIKVFKPKRAIKLTNTSPANVAGNLVANGSMDRLFYRNTSSGVSTMYQQSPGQWAYQQNFVAGVSNVDGDLVWNETRQVLFYKNTTGGISHFYYDDWSPTHGWVNAPLSADAPNNVAGSLVTNAAGNRLFYKNTSGGISAISIYQNGRWNYESSPFQNAASSPYQIAPTNVDGELTWSENRQALFYKTTDNKIHHIFRDTWSFPTAQWAWGPVVTVNPETAPANVAGELEWSETRNVLFYKDTDNEISHIYMDSWTNPSHWIWKYAKLGFPAPSDISMYTRMTEQPGSWYANNTFVTGGMKWSDDESSLFFTGPKNKIYRIFWQNNKWNIQVVKWRGADRPIINTSLIVPDEIFSGTEVADDSNLEILGQSGVGKPGKFICYKTSDINPTNPNVITHSIGLTHWINPVRLDPPCNNENSGLIPIHINVCNICRPAPGTDIAHQQTVAKENQALEIPESAELTNVNVLNSSLQIIKNFERISKQDLEHILDQMQEGFYIVRYTYRGKWISNKYYKTN